MRVGSLFSGIGGLDLGLERAGMTVVWQSEIDPYASRVLAKHWPHVPNLGDVTCIDWSTVEPVDLICGGFPCQPVSSSGQKRGSEDSYWLWPEFLRAVRSLRPRFVVVENVADLLVRGLEHVADGLAAEGYDLEWAVLPAAAFGLPQRRPRVFVVADRDGGRREGLEERDGEGPRYFRRLDLDGLAVAEHRATQAASRVRRVDDGFPHRVDRLRALGNAVVPQVAEYVGRLIVAAIEDRSAA